MRIFLLNGEPLSTGAECIWFQTGPDVEEGTFVDLEIHNIEPSGLGMRELEGSHVEVSTEELITALTILRDIKQGKED